MAHINESWHTWMSHGTHESIMAHMNETCHIWMSHGTYGRVTSNLMPERCVRVLRRIQIKKKNFYVQPMLFDVNSSKGLSKAQSSKLVVVFPLKRDERDVWASASSFERAFERACEHITSNWIGCMETCMSMMYEYETCMSVEKKHIRETYM